MQRLQNLADRLLELAGLEKRRTLDDLKPVDLAQQVQEVGAAMEPALRRKGIRLQVEVAAGLKVEGDAFLLQQALLNLVSNALEFSPPDGVIEVRAAAAGRRVEITVRDHGPGVPEYALDRVFERFYSLRRPDSGNKGTGLGLSFVREIAHLHGGEAHLANHPNGGASAVLALPSMMPGRRLSGESSA